MKTLLLNILYSAIRRYIGGGVFDRVKAAVEGINDADIPGKDKRQHVLAALSFEVRQVGMVAIAAATEIIVLRLRAG